MNSATINRKNMGKWATTLVALGFASLVFPSGASADHRVVVSAGGHSRAGHLGAYGMPVRSVTVLPSCDERARRIWREPVYAVRSVRVEIPPVVVTERIPRYNGWGRIVGYDLVERVVEPGRNVWRNERVLVQAGYWETVVDRACASPNHGRGAFENVVFRPVPRSGPSYLKIQKSRPHDRLTRDTWPRRVHDRDLQVRVRLDR